jgi:hypothetical protein
MSNLYAPHILNNVIIYNNGDKTGCIIEEYYSYKLFWTSCVTAFSMFNSKG